jgi:serine/threonine protein kinase
MQPTQPTAPIASLPQPGDVLVGKYRVEGVIGVGGMGSVVSARHLQLDERVAIKFLLPEMAGYPEVVQRFLREARSAIKIRSEHCVRVLDVGQLESGAPYMVMEYLEGQDLSAVLARHRPLPVADTVDWVLQACEALAEAHALGIVHRDLKPANLFLTHRADGTPCVKVLDFGISKQSASASDAGVTKTQAILGSPRYMSPEQMRSTRDVDARADVWALGAVVHELVAGEPPFDAETMTALCAAILQDPPRPMRATRPDAPPELERVLGGALEKDRDRRYANVAQLAAVLAPFGSSSARASAERIARVLGLGPGGTDPRFRGAPSGSMPVSVPPTSSTARPPGEVATGSLGRPSRAPAIGMAVVGLLLFAGVGAAGLVVYHQRSAGGQGTPPAVASSAPLVVLPPPPASAVVLAEPAPAVAPSASASSTPVASTVSSSRASAGGGAGAAGHLPGHRPVVAPATGGPPSASPQKSPPNANPFGDDRHG